MRNKILILSAMMLPLALTADIHFSFDSGDNQNQEAGIADFGKKDSSAIPGLSSTHDPRLTLAPSPTLDPGKAFSPSPWGKACRIGIDSERQHFFSASVTTREALLRQEQGTVAFWISPENWQGNDRKFHIFFSAKGNDAEFLLYKYSDKSRLYFLMGNQKKGDLASGSISSWQPGEWHYVCAVWTPNMLHLYLDGKLAGSVNRTRKAQNNYTQIQTGTRNWPLEEGTSLLDELTLLTSPWSEDKVIEEYQKRQIASMRRNAPLKFDLPQAKEPIAIDGAVTSGEYSLTVNLGFSPADSRISLQDRWHFSADSRYLYFAAETPRPVQSEKTAARTHDAPLWEEDSLELYLEHNEQLYQFIINPTGTVFDSRNGKQEWHCPGLKTVSASHKNSWHMELAIPWAELGIRPESGTRIFVNAARNGKTGEALSRNSLSPVIRSYGNRANFTALELQSAPGHAIWDFQTPPGLEGKLTLNFTSDASEGSLYCKAEAKGRCFLEKSRPVKPGKKETVQESGLPDSGLLTLEWRSMDKSSKLQIPLTTLTPWIVEYLWTDTSSQTLSTAIRVQTALPENTVFIQQMSTSAGKAILTHKTSIPATTRNQLIQLKWDLTQLPPDTYEYTITQSASQSGAGEYRQLFRKPTNPAPWDQFSEKRSSDELQEPWKKQQWQQNKLLCTTQLYDFTQALFPQKISVNGIPLLKEPIHLLLDRSIVNTKVNVRQSPETPETVEAATTINNLLITTKTESEYDGLLKITLTLTPANGKEERINSLALLIPMTAPHSKLVTSFIPMSVPQKYQSGRLGKHWEKNVLAHPAVWIGNGDQGLFWGAENLRGSHIASPDTSLTINKGSEDGAAEIRINLVDAPLLLKGSRTIHFFLQATPMKPEKRDPYGWTRIHSGMFLNTWQQYFNCSDPDFLDLREVARKVAAISKRTPVVFHYSCIYGVAPYGPDWGWFGADWIATPPELGKFKIDFPASSQRERDKNTWAFGCLNNASFRNSQLYQLQKALNSNAVGINNLYFDMAYARMCGNARHGCCWTDDFGRPQKTLNITGTRTFAQAIRNMLLKKNPDGMLMFHVSGEPLPPICAFADVVVDGEDFVSELAKKENYYGIFDLEMFQACYSGRKWGVRYAYIPQFGRSAIMFNPKRAAFWRQPRKTPEAIKAVRHFIGYTLLHDTLVFSSLGVHPELSAIETALHQFGWDNQLTFLPYWENQLLRTSTGLPVSCYRRADNVLAVVVNTTATPQSLQLEWLPQKPFHSVSDAENAKPLSSRGKTIPLTLDAYELKLLWIKE